MKTVAVLLPALAASACLLHADPFVIGGATYTAGGPSEIVAVDFTQSNGGSTSNQYYGFVRLTVSGVGQSLGTAFNDAFYVYTDGAGNPIAPFNDVNFYQLAIDTAPLVGSPGNPTNPIHNARLHTFFDVFADIEVAPLYVPAFQANHVYDFIISVPSLNSYVGGLSTLNFGVSNGIFADNSGAYQIQVQQLVPEPGSVVLLATAMALALGVRRYRRR
jgi:hypothetical protein